MFGGEAPVGVEADDEEPHGLGDQSVEGSLVSEGVEVVHHSGEIEIAQGVEAAEEPLALVLEVALHREVDAEVGFQFVPLGLATELLLEGLLREVGDVGHHPGYGQALAGRCAAAEELPLAET